MNLEDKCNELEKRVAKLERMLCSQINALPKVSIPWDKIPEEYSFVAIDRNGYLCAHREMPYLNLNATHWQTDKYYSRLIRDLGIDPYPNYKSTVVRRPVNVKRSNSF